jgi:hypothetical protein
VIAAINLALLTVFNLMSRVPRQECTALKLFNIVLALLTLLLIATAFSKMALYIDAYGLSMLRLIPCVFMVFLAVVFLAVIVLQKWRFSVVRLALTAGAMLLCLFCLVNPDGSVVRYNTDRYLSGTLSDYDTDILYRADAAGVLPALEVWEETSDEALKTELELYLTVQKEHLSETRGTYLYNVESELAWRVFWKRASDRSELRVHSLYGRLYRALQKKRS